MLFQQIRNKIKFLSFWKYLLVIALPFLCYPLIDELFRHIYTVIAERDFLIYKRNTHIPLDLKQYIEHFLLSIGWYAILIALFINIPLASFLQCFKEKQRYEYYKIFWWISLFIFTILTVLTCDGYYSMAGSDPIIMTSISTPFCILYLTLIPGAYLYSKQSKLPDNNASACLFSTLEYRCSFAIIAIALFTVSPIKVKTLTGVIVSISRAILETFF
ncbi:MAG: hypothetical protein KAH20_15940 [Methylococcales bacterium]|nr:hypothetical protein [Methylococcales bacterium]